MFGYISWEGDVWFITITITTTDTHHFLSVRCAKKDEGILSRRHKY